MAHSLSKLILIQLYDPDSICNPRFSVNNPSFIAGMSVIRFTAILDDQTIDIDMPVAAMEHARNHRLQVERNLRAVGQWLSEQPRVPGLKSTIPEPAVQEPAVQEPEQ